VSSSWLATSQGAIMLLLVFVIRYCELYLREQVPVVKSSNLLVSFRGKNAAGRGIDTRYGLHQLLGKHVCKI